MLNMDVDFGAFIVSGILAYALGLFWYHPKVMGEQWAQARGVKTDNHISKTPLVFVASFFLWILAACFYAFLASFLEIRSPEGFFMLSCLIWVAFSMPPAIMGALYTGYPFEAVAIDTSYQLGGYFVFAAVHSIFILF